MRRFFQVLIEHLQIFLGLSPTKPPLTTPSQQEAIVLNTIQLALYKQSAIHVIYDDKSFTGEIVKFDQVKQQLILKNFKKKVTSIIAIKDIKRVSLVPDSVKEVQKRAFH